MFQRVYPVVVILIFLLAFAVRIVNLETLPNGLQQDETSLGYNAYSILLTGKDEYGKDFPVYFKAFGEYKLPVYIYSAVLPLAVFDVTAFAVRFPSAFFGFLTVIVFYFLIKELVSKEQRLVPLFAATLLAINPWHIHFSRGAFEVTEAVFFMLLGLFLFLKSLKPRFSFLLPFAMLSFAITMYTYNISRMLTPLFVLYLFVAYRTELLRISKTVKGISIALTLFILLPFIVLFFSSGGLQSTRGTMLFSSGIMQASLLELRTYTIDLPSIIGQLFFNKWVLSFYQYIKNIVSYLSVEFFFLNGSTHGNHGIGAMGMFYLFELPLFITGIWLAVKHKSKSILTMFVWMIGVILVASLTREAPYGTRSFFLVISVEFFVSLGLFVLLQKVSKLKTLPKIAILGVCGVFAFFNIVYFGVLYTQRFPKLYAEQWKAPDRELALFLAEQEKTYDKIVIDSDANVVYTSLLYYTAFSPKNFYTSVARYPEDSEGFTKVKSFGIYEFRKINWDQDRQLKRTLFVTTPKKQFEKAKEIKVIYYPERTAVFADKQTILQMPVKDQAYIIFTAL